MSSWIAGLQGLGPPLPFCLRELPQVKGPHLICRGDLEVLRPQRKVTALPLEMYLTRTREGRGGGEEEDAAGGSARQWTGTEQNTLKAAGRGAPGLPPPGA